MSDRGAAGVAVIIGATSKWQADGSFTKFRHGQPIDDTHMPLEARWGIGGAIAQKFAREGYHVVLTSRTAANAAGLAEAIAGFGGEAAVVEMDVRSAASIREGFARIRAEVGEPDAVIYDVGYADGRELPEGQELLEYIPDEMFDNAIALAGKGPFLVGKEILPTMRRRGSGSYFLTNNQQSVRGRKRRTGQSLYYPRALMRTLAEVLTEEYSPHGVHIANVIVDGSIDSPGTHAIPAFRENPALLLNPARIADAYYYLHTQDRSCWTHEIQLTPHICPVTV
jgi:NAD(P)-dependent dehydrogenase (short-subunit alcohol dehydrogenase family)